MIKFERSMDEHSLDIMRNGKFVGFLQWHVDREPRVHLCDQEPLALSEILACLKRLREELAKAGRSTALLDQPL